MSFLPDELPVSLDKLEDHLKAILKIKIREFVHLNPIFNCIPSIDVDIYNRTLTDAADKVEQSLKPVVHVNNDGQAAQPIISLPDARPTSLEPISRSQFRQNVLGNNQSQRQYNEISPLSALSSNTDVPASPATGPVPSENVGGHSSASRMPSSKSYFAGFDIDCPNQSRQLPVRRRYTRRSPV